MVVHRPEPGRDTHGLLLCACRSSTFAYLRENHNSVLGMREYALEAGGSFKAVNETFVEAWVRDEECGSNLIRLQGSDGAVRHMEGDEGPVYNLFAFPAEDNFAGWCLAVAPEAALIPPCLAQRLAIGTGSLLGLASTPTRKPAAAGMLAGAGCVQVGIAMPCSPMHP